MTARPRTVYVCSACGDSAPKWQGQCPACGAWNTLAAHAPARAPARRGGGPPPAAVAATLDAAALAEAPRLATGSGEFDRVLGGGLVAGSVTLIGGDPGIGKSTLLLQAAAALAPSAPVLYATGEESLRQVGLRARRLGLAAGPLAVLADSGVESILAAATAAGSR
ncbi:MAG TPA: AAA family ATPase, partial [Steroidobacteraceae bacterium]|nr:AAA family ATPase [Steroidobacteraceae bacterium]